MKRFSKHSLVFSILLSVLVGCGGDSSSSEHNDNQTRWNQITSQDVNYRISLATASTIDLANYTQAINSGVKLELISFEQIGNRPSCTQYKVEQSKVVFEMTSAQECYYNYTMEDIESRSMSSAMLRVAAGSLQQSVRQFSAVTQIGGSVLIRVNDGTTVPEGYMIDEESIQVLGHGRAEIHKENPNEIYYYASPEESSQGLHRVVFSYISSDNQSIIQGLIDVAVGLTVQNYAPKAVNFRYGDHDSYTEGQQLKHIYVEERQEVKINIAEYYTQGYLDAYDQPIELLDDNGDPIIDEQGNRVHYYLEPNGITSTPIYQPGNYLIDRDKNRLQLVEVFTYDAYVNIVSKDFTNTEFIFKSNRQGTHYVTYVLSDHNGGYGTGIIEIKVGGDIPTFIPPWNRFLSTKTNKFKAPLTRYDADYQGLKYTTVTEEDGTSGPYGWGTPLFDYNDAELICSQIGMRLPKLNELLALQNIYPAGLYNSLDLFNPSEDKQKMKVNWPTSAHFWTRAEFGMGTTSAMKLDANFNIEYSIPVTSSEQRAVVCINQGQIIEITVTPSPVVLAKGQDQQLEAIAIHDDSTSSDVTSSVTWDIADKSIATVRREGLLSGINVGSTYLTAMKDGIISNIVTINVCDVGNLAGACIDIADIGNGKLFTNSPSVAFLDSIGGGITNDIYTENGTQGPVGSFYTFNWTNANKLCATYNSKMIGGRNNWRLPTEPELSNELFNTYGHMFKARGWPVTFYYWSATAESSVYNDVSLYTGYRYRTNPAYSRNVSCVSNP